jgi:hypothetical protein
MRRTGFVLRPARFAAAGDEFNIRLQCRQRTTSERVDKWHDLQ